MKVKLSDLAHGRSGDKGDNCNIGIITESVENYEIIKKHVTADLVKKYFQGICKGKVDRYEMPNILALNFVLHESLDGGGTTSLNIDSQGKTLAAALLMLELDIDS